MNRSELAIITPERRKESSLHLFLVSTLYHSFGNQHIQMTLTLFNLTPTVLTTSSIPEGPWHVITYNLLRHELKSLNAGRVRCANCDDNVTAGFPCQAMYRESYRLAFERFTLILLWSTLWGKKTILILHLKVQDLNVVGTGRNLLTDWTYGR